MRNIGKIGHELWVKWIDSTYVNWGTMDTGMRQPYSIVWHCNNSVESSSKKFFNSHIKFKQFLSLLLVQFHVCRRIASWASFCDFMMFKTAQNRKGQNKKWRLHNTGYSSFMSLQQNAECNSCIQQFKFGAFACAEECFCAFWYSSDSVCFHYMPW